MLKLERGDPVGAPVYEAAGRTLGTLLEGWSEETPRQILEGGPIPEHVRRDRQPVADPDDNESATDPTDVAEEPKPHRYPDREGFLEAVIENLFRQGESRESIELAVAEIIAEYEHRRHRTDGNDSDTACGGVV